MSSKNPKDDEPTPKPTDQTGAVPLQPAGEVIVSHEETAAKPPPGKQIHRRRPLPPVPEKDAKQSPTDAN